MSRYYAGVGSRETPSTILPLMESVADKMEKEGWILRSGGAAGADTFFEQGVKDPKNKEIYLPSQYFNGRSANNMGFIDATQLASYSRALKTVSLFHPAPGKLTDFAKKLMARNAMQVLGSSLESPSALVIAWTKEGKFVGGTSQALRIAKYHNIPILNLGNPEDNLKVRDWVDGKGTFLYDNLPL
jgi:hypothetical protein